MKRPFSLAATSLWLMIMACCCLFPAQALARPELSMGILRNSPPVAFVNSQGAARGLAVDLALFLGSAMKVKVHLYQGTAAELKTLLAAGDIDVICGIPSQQSLFAPPFHAQVTPFALNRHIMVATPDTHITCEQDYPGRRLAVLSFDDYADRAEKAGAYVLLVDSYQEGLAALTTGLVDAFVPQSGEIASYLVQQGGMDNVRIMGLSLERIPLVLVVRNGEHSDLPGQLNSALFQLERSGNLNLLREKWLGRSIQTESFFERYRNIIVYTALALCLLMLLIVTWIFTLRREVRAVTRRLQRSERRYRELIEASPDMILLLARDGHIRLANRIAREILQIGQATEDSTSALLQCLCDADRLCFTKLLEAVTEGKVVREEIILHADTDKQRFMEFIATVTASTDLGDELVCCIGRDMTERRQIEHELIQVERLAVLGKLAASVAHEINNPLGIIMTHTEVALEETEHSPLRNHLVAIQRNVERAAATTCRLLNTAMPRDINREPQDLGDIIRETLTFLRPSLGKVHIDLSGMDTALPLEGDRLLLEQLCVNIFLNAADSMGEEGTLRLRGQVHPDKDEPTVRVAVCDSGKGIQRENLERIFDIFFTTRTSKGFGLGLFISRRIAEGHGGKLYAESELGKGACLIMEFPALAPSEQH